MIDVLRSGQCLLVGFVFLAVSCTLTACAHSIFDTSADATNKDSSEPPPAVAGKSFPSRLPRTGPVTLRADHPQRYTVQPGDTPQQVAEVFLEQPWRWSEVWRPGSEMDDPEQLFPGEVIELYHQQGQPRLRLMASVPNIKLSPQIRSQPIEDVAPVIPRQAISSFLEQSIVTSRSAWSDAPIIIANSESRAIAVVGHKIYVEGITSSEQLNYRIYRGGKQYRDPVTRRPLGLEGRYVGEAVLEKIGNPSVFALTDSRIEARGGDRLFPVDKQQVQSLEFKPQVAPPDTQGHVVAVLADGVAASQYQSIVVNLGEQDGMEPGYLFDIVGTDEVPRQGLLALSVRQVDRHVGSLMLYKIHENVSYGLITHLNDTVEVSDRVQSP